MSDAHRPRGGKPDLSRIKPPESGTAAIPADLRREYMQGLSEALQLAENRIAALEAFARMALRQHYESELGAWSAHLMTQFRKGICPICTEAARLGLDKEG